MTVANEQITDASSNSGLSNFRITVEGLLELLDLEEEDEYGILRPTEYAFRTAMKLIAEAYDSMGNSFPKCSIGTDDQGSIRLAWQNLNTDCRVRLFCPSNAEDTAYIYHQKNQEYKSEDLISASTLVHWLEWFNQV
ncbi:MAG: hypothetical protein JGK24_30105 [Microcoleus sp. PH2017_29_MFU_D_A]|uniref:hypothetical protein n=1 Tax=unclassified Microcoleus TaxID=2642155 RepID=UPI001D6670D6|nr:MULTISPECIES: hypothetical protein [unclassified Microcoleus]MCC3421969.1 hypothetical protein [Microcoleus sp. PH2017_07_MST_O_A]MCC3512049.1 hypothetical protein [Microcoleus sp. PH2017_17_BER_D_A]TAE55663.1 MAG: hypothetical protein EAZ88_06015 [Oscillatoriales cyanobacterium]MCC3607366.1 hypothetical protein [Microcoleus sp. PH2017_29_MFU_D_A]MCC3633566.1 hypothetical protein [Microcoleus sp. PH2017_37_MFU_D_B]